MAKAETALGIPEEGGATRVDRVIHGSARLGRRTKRLVKRLSETDIAVINHSDIDAISAEELVDSGVRAVINNTASTTGRYPNAGPMILVEAGVRLVDVTGPDLFKQVKEGDPLRIEGGRVFLNGSLLAEGQVLDREHLIDATERGRRRIGGALEEFAENTMSHLRQEVGILSDKIEFPTLDTKFRDRHALVVVRGSGFKRDLQAIRPYIREVKPVVVGVDGGGDALLKAGIKPNMIVGDMDSASDSALKSGAELVVHAYPDDRAPGKERLEQLGLQYKVVPAPGTSQDVAMLLAFEQGASLIVTVGSHFNLVEFLDKDRAGMSSTFLTRLRIGETLVDTKGVSRLYRPAPGRGQLLLLFSAALVTIVIVVLSSPQLDRLTELIWLKLRILFGG